MSLQLVKTVRYGVIGYYLCRALPGLAHTAPAEHYTISPLGYYQPRPFVLVLHYTGCRLKRALNLLTKPNGSVSAHYLVPSGPINGRRFVYQLVSELDRSWCQGISGWQGNIDLNTTGISIEIVNKVRTNRKGRTRFTPYPVYQIATVAMLSRDIINRYNIEPTHVVGHADIAPDRKRDPGPLFPWEQLYKVYGIGAWPNEADVRYYKTFVATDPNLYGVLYNLVLYGYPIKIEGSEETQWNQITKVVTAFQMHFRQSSYDGYIDKETTAILYALVKKYRSTIALEPNTCAQLKALAKQLQPFYQQTRRCR